jgi:hypothetical protein
MLFVPDSGAELNVIALPATVNEEFGFWITLSIATITCATDAIGRDSVNVTVTPLPLK